MKLLIFYVTFTIFGEHVSPERQKKCIMYDECEFKPNSFPWNRQNCPYSGPPMLLNDTKALVLLKQLCPGYFIGNLLFLKFYKQHKLFLNAYSIKYTGWVLAQLIK